MAGTSVLVALLVAGLGVWGGIANVRVPDAAPRGAWHHAGSSPRQAQIASEDLDYLRRQVGKLRAQAEEDRSLATVLEIAEIEEQIDAVDRGDADRADLLGALNAVARRGHLAGIEDVLETVRHSRPPPREPPAAPPPPPTPTPPGGDGRTPSKVPGTASGQAPGDVHDPELRGDRTRARAATEDVRVTAADERATTRRETVRSAAKHGFAGAPYRRVYAEYEAIVGDVMHAEEVPGTRRYVIERYFDRIRPW